MGNEVPDTIVHPLGDRVLLKLGTPKEQTKGGLHLPDQVKQQPLWGEVVATGPGLMLESGVEHKQDLKVGDVVLYPRYAGVEIQKGLLLINGADILCRVNNPTDEWLNDLIN